MYFEHASEIWQEFPELVAGVIQTGGIVLSGPGKELLRDEMVRKSYLGEE